MKTIWKLEMGQIKDELESDKFFQSLSSEHKELILKNLSKKDFSPHWIGDTKYKNGIYHGDIKVCPKCEKVRITSCAACGCGHCHTCNHRYSCMPPRDINFKGLNLNQPSEFSKIIPIDNALEDYMI